jgi:hypothetical protein
MDMVSNLFLYFTNIWQLYLSRKLSDGNGIWKMEYYSMAYQKLSLPHFMSEFFGKYSIPDDSYTSMDFSEPHNLEGTVHTLHQYRAYHSMESVLSLYKADDFSLIMPFYQFSQQMNQKLRSIFAIKQFTSRQPKQVKPAKSVKKQKAKTVIKESAKKVIKESAKKVIKKSAKKGGKKGTHKRSKTYKT